MTNRRRHEDWIKRAQKVQDICAIPSTPLWQKAHRVAAVYQDVQLDGFQSKHRHKIFAALSSINEILARYPIETFDDYQLVETKDLEAIINTFKALGSIKI